MRPFVLAIKICRERGSHLRSQWLPVEYQVTQKVKVIHLTLIIQVS